MIYQRFLKCQQIVTLIQYDYLRHLDIKKLTRLYFTTDLDNIQV